MTKTEHYQLNQWDPSDSVRRTDFNEDNAKIDAAIKQEGWSGHVQTGSYVGTGLHGKNHPNRLEFGFKPELVIIGGGDRFAVFVRDCSWVEVVESGSAIPQVTTWGDTYLEWYVYYDNSNGTPHRQLNEEGKTYRYIVFH